MKEMLKRFVREEDGQGMVEYALIVAAIALIAVGAIWAFGDKIEAFMGNIDLDPADPTP
ncbi:MAG: Flp family type IVb pilin [Desulfosporosinus sp.]|jgi:pilus assembly protein Flp/PilA